ncbi:ABC transporter permease [Rhodococcus triatomae]|uniref:NitT/TauT family transport system permease protein n=1 Tax=Rhodococcus triatomae TaxID=300028 RepID=A0A1G8BB05_9NOCA|nr:ABC transporter permease [Rhodococcus triatomae]QNG17486.1 ABC transporter permease [Rhodococcus triatomae]QNG22846.1 ABC transporter permease [Rhodococcus triatomae]SDH30284.1 NitT/TauT family transport system permease protein [Rhodococcus triatomae]
MNLLSEPLGRSRQIGYGITGIIGTALVAEVVLRTGLISTPGLPVPSQVLAETGSLIGDQLFWQEVAFTLQEWMLGLLIATIAGVVLGGLMGAFTKVFIAFELPVEVFRVLPSVALGPILVLLLGSGMLPLSLTVALACVWPILLNTMYGVRATDATAVQTARTFGLSGLAVLARIKIPSALPFAFTGIRISASIGLIVAVSAELLIGNGQGIGGYILVNSANAMNLDTVYAATLVAGILGVAVSMVFTVLDNKVFAWKKGLAQ